MKKVVFALSALALTSGSVFAADSGDGTVKFTGEIVDTPCVLSVDSQKQEVVLGQVLDWPPESPDNQYHLFK